MESRDYQQINARNSNGGLNPNGQLQANNGTGGFITFRVASFLFDLVSSDVIIRTIQDEIIKKLRAVLDNIEISCVFENHDILEPKQVQGATEEPQDEIPIVRNQTVGAVSPKVEAHNVDPELSQLCSDGCPLEEIIKLVDRVGKQVEAHTVDPELSHLFSDGWSLEEIIKLVDAVSKQVHGDSWSLEEMKKQIDAVDNYRRIWGRQRHHMNCGEPLSSKLFCYQC